MTQEDADNIHDLEIKEQLYLLFLEMKEELTKKNIEIDKDQLDELAETTKIDTIINYIREMVYILINTKFPSKDEAKTVSNLNKDTELSQLENHIRKLEYDIRYLLQKEFQNKKINILLKKGIRKKLIKI